MIKRILEAEPRLGPVYLSKVDLVDEYMHLWVCIEDTTTTAFLTPPTKVRV